MSTTTTDQDREKQIRNYQNKHRIPRAQAEREIQEKERRGTGRAAQQRHHQG
jgi:hypothetical protein